MTVPRVKTSERQLSRGFGTLGTMADTERRRLTAIGSRVREQRELLGMSRDELAQRVAISGEYIRSIERGHRLPAVDVFERLADALNVSVDALLKGKDINAWEQVARLEAIAKQLRRINLEEAGLVRAFPVTVLGKIPADTFRWMWSEGEQYPVSVPVDVMAGHPLEDIFAAEVSGDCLLGLQICDGDILVCTRATDRPKTGALVIVRLGDEETCKTWHFAAGGTVELRDGASAVVWHGYPEQLVVEGIVLGVIRKTA